MKRVFHCSRCTGEMKSASPTEVCTHCGRWGTGRLFHKTCSGEYIYVIYPISFSDGDKTSKKYGDPLIRICRTKIEFPDKKMVSEIMFENGIPEPKDVFINFSKPLFAAEIIGGFDFVEAARLGVEHPSFLDVSGMQYINHDCLSADTVAFHYMGALG